MIPQIVKSPISDTWFVVTRYRTLKNGNIVASKKYDVTDQVRKILKDHAPKKKGRRKR